MVGVFRMGWCGDEDDEKNLIITSETLEISATSLESMVISSPMNSNFSALVSKDILRAIVELLPAADLARAACVCRLWNAVASEREVQERVFFRSPWKVDRVVGFPSSAGFWRHAGLGRFAISHHLVRGDTIVGLALKYSVQVMDIKRLNNMISDHGIHSRERLLIPISNPELLINSTCYIEMDVYAKREVAVLYLEGCPDGKARSHMMNQTLTGRGRRKILDSVKRSLQVDDATAEYYLSISNGDPRAAIFEYSSDLRWEHASR